MLTTIEQFDPEKAFGWIDLAANRKVVVAVSGGSDSVALLLALKRWTDTAGSRSKLCAVTVDHGLRAGSADEAEYVQSLCIHLGIEHRTKRWLGPKPASGLSEAAREARYALLAEAAREVGTNIVLTGHTANDQAETVFMRSNRGKGRGLTGMAEATLFNRSIWIIRPFLAEEREALRRLLRQEGVNWIEDPTNIDNTFERVRARSVLETTGDVHLLVDSAHQAANVRVQTSQVSADLLKRAASVAAPGLVKLDFDLLGPEGPRVDVLRVLLACCGGRAHPANRAAMTNFMENLKTGRTCLSGTVAVKRRDAVFLYREQRRGSSLLFADGIFDGRYRLGREAVDAGWRLRTTSRDNPCMDFEGVNVPGGIVKAALAAEPELYCENAQRAGVKPQIERYLAPFDHFLPEFDLKLANAAADLFGREPYPAPPVTDGDRRIVGV